MAYSAEAARLRKQQQRAREKAAMTPIFYTRPDWRLFIDRNTLPQKAGCEPHQIGRVVLKELVDNALDADAKDVTLNADYDPRSCTVTDDGPGIDDVGTLFAVNRPLISSKLKRLPTRGMLGNGLRVVMGAVAAFNGKIAVTTKGHRYDLTVDTATGHTLVDEMPATLTRGTRIELQFPQPLFDSDAYKEAHTAIFLAGSSYPGPSHPKWYGPNALRETIVAASDATVSDVINDLFGINIEDLRPTGSLSSVGAQELLSHLGNPPEHIIKELGRNTFNGHYHQIRGYANIDGGEIPFCVEAWVSCCAANKGDDLSFYMEPIINRSPSLARVNHHSNSGGLYIHGCGLRLRISAAKRADYTITLSLITPFLRLSGDGKAPVLSDFEDVIQEAIRDAATAAYRKMLRPPREMSIKAAAYRVMEKAYLKASDNGKLPANARQIMYAARPDIILMTGNKKLRANYFNQTLLPDYISEHPDETKNWDVVYDARGHLVEPHTQHQVSLGTIEVREYLGEKTSLGSAAKVNTSKLYPTSGPVNRYMNILFVEKEGFDPLFRAARLAEKYDLAIMSTKGMSVTAARLLIDRSARNIEKVFVLHDLDIAGFTIFGTLGADNRRYTYDNFVEFVDLGLRLSDAEEMGLESETVAVEEDEENAKGTNEEKHQETMAKRRATLARHGATDEEIEFLIPEEGECRRIELNAMTSRQFIDFIEEKLEEHGVEKLVPSADTLITHARRLREQTLAREALDKMAAEIAREAAATELPDNMEERIREILDEDPELSWDEALAQLIAQGEAH